MQDTHVILTAFDVKGADRPAAHRALQERLVPLLESQDPTSPIESWWVAEDDRLDGSDNDSATFCELGSQARAHELLVAVGLAQAPQSGPELDAVEDWFVETIYNTDADGNPVPEDDWSNRTLHGPFRGEEAARYFMEEVWPDGDTDIREQIRGPLNRPSSLTGPLPEPGTVAPVTCRICGARVRLADPESWVHDEDGDWGDHSAEPVQGGLR